MPKVSKLKKRFKFLLVGLFSIGVATAIFSYFYLKNFYKKVYVAPSNAPTPKPEKKVYNLLLLGYGGPGHDGAYLTDTIILAHIDKLKKRVLLISIPRDLWVKVPTKNDFIYSKINALYQMGLFPKKFPFLPEEYKKGPAIKLLKETIERITGLKIDYFAAVNFNGFKEFINILDGVKVYLEKPLDDYQYPIAGKEKDLCGKSPEELPELEKIATKSPVLAFPCRYEHFHLDAGWVKLNGETALKFVRARHVVGEKGDFGRSARQQKLLEAIGKKMLEIGIIPKIPSLLESLSNNLKTDVPLSLIKQNLKELYKINEYQIETTVISTDNFLTDTLHPQGGYILYPKEGVEKWEKIREYVKGLVNNKTQNSKDKSQN